MGNRSGVRLVGRSLALATLSFVLAGPCVATGESPADDAFLNQIEVRALRYFEENTHPVTGLVRDRARNDGSTPAGAASRAYDVASIAATGFALASVANAAERGFVTREYAERYCLRALRFVEGTLFKYRGWLYHFVEWSTGRRYGRSEVSTVDTALFLAGALYAGAVFSGTDVERIADRLYRAVDFPDMMTDGAGNRVDGGSPSFVGPRPDPAKRTLSMGWTPEGGYLAAQWNRYAEQLVLLVLGLGSPTFPLPPAAWRAVERHETPDASGAPIYGGDLPLFVHQYSHLFLDFRHFDDGYRNYADNSVRAAVLNRAVCAGDASKQTYRAGLWGLSAGGSPWGYRAYGPKYHDGTVCLGCAAASYPFLSHALDRDFDAWRKLPWWDRLWGRYGFSDSTNLDADWFDPDAIGITIGAAYLALASRDGVDAPTVWSRFQSIGAVREGLRRAAFH